MSVYRIRVSAREVLVLTEREYYGLVAYLYENQYKPSPDLTVRINQRVGA